MKKRDTKKLEEIVEKDSDLSYLAIGEPAFGTAVYDPAMMDGLAAFLDINKDSAKKIKYLFIVGGLIPEIPEFYSKYNAMKMRFLASDPSKSPNDWVKELVDHADLDNETKSYLEEFALHIIKDKNEAVGYAKKELKKVIDVLPNLKEIHYIHGEEDEKNLLNLQDLKIVQYQDKGRKKDYLEGKIDLLQKFIQSKREELESVDKQREFMKKARDYVRNRDPSDFKKYVQDLLAKKENDLAKLSMTEGLSLKKFLLSATSKDQIETKLNELDSDITRLSKEQKEKDKEISELELNLNAIKREKQMGPNITKRREIEAPEENIIFRLTKQEYNNLLYGIVEDTTKLHIHTNAEKILDLDGKVIALSHNTNFLSDNPTKAALKEMKDSNTFASRMGISVPDVRLCAHGLDGLRHQAQPKHYENTIEGEVRDTPEMVMNIQLPTFQSCALHEYYKDKKLKNWHTKRYYSKNYASGAVIHTIQKDGVHVIEFIEGTDLINHFGKASKELSEKSLSLALEKNKEKKAKLESIISSIREKLIISKTYKIEHIGDVHVGVGNDFGRPSNYKFVDAAQQYQKEHGLPDAIITSELAHGIWRKPFDSTKQSFQLLPYEADKEIEEIKNDKKLDTQQKLEKLEQLFIKHVHATGINTEDGQKEEIKYRIMPYFEQILEKGGKLIVVSGNHYNTTFTGDEAKEIALMVDKKYDKQVIAIDGLGQPGGGRNQFRLYDMLLYGMHKPKRGVDELNGVMKQIRGTNIPAKMVFMFHFHQPGGAFADGTAYSMNPGMQPWDQYVSEIGKQGSLRGILNVEISPSLKYFKWSYVLDPTLERYMKKEVKK